MYCRYVKTLLYYMQVPYSNAKSINILYHAMVEWIEETRFLLLSWGTGHGSWNHETTWKYGSDVKWGLKRTKIGETVMPVSFLLELLIIEN